MPSKIFDDRDHEQFMTAMKNNLKNWRSAEVGRRLERWVDMVEADSQSRVPVDTGRTKNSWFRENDFKKTIVRINFGYDKDNEIRYVPIIYQKPDGFFKNNKEPFWLRRAVEANRDKLDRILSNK